MALFYYSDQIVFEEIIILDQTDKRHSIKRTEFGARMLVNSDIQRKK